MVFKKKLSKISLLIAMVLSLLIAPMLNPIAAFAHVGEHTGEEVHKLLVVTHTAGYRHGSIEDAKDVLPEWGEENNFEVTFVDETENARPDDLTLAEAFSDEFLADYDAIMFANTTSNFGTEAQREAVINFVENGGGFVGAHAAIDTGYDWPEYGEMVGTYFDSHPWTQEVNFLVEDDEHPSTEHLTNGEWSKLEEVYIFPEDMNPREAGKHILLSLDTESVDGPRGGQFDDHPTSWCSPQESGRVFITALGHHSQTWSSEEEFKQHILGGLDYAFGMETDTNCDQPSVKPGLISETLTDAVPRPTSLEVTDDNRVFSISINGGVYETQPNGSTNEILEINTTTEGEHGVMGIALDPEFEDNGHIYIYYSVPGYTEDGEIINNLSRFTYEDGSVSPSTEEVLLEVPSDPQCCHQAGFLEFGPDDKLYVTTGDNKPATNGPQAESVETAQNLGDLRGSILRLNKDGSAPEDNPFVDVEGARDEIYAYGFRNPYRISFDPETGYIYEGDVGPDGDNDYDEFNVVTEPGQNFGWPYVIGDTPYDDYDQRFKDFAANFDFSTVAGDFSADDVLTEPEEILDFAENEAQDPIAFYPYGAKEPWGSGGRTSNAGPVYDPGSGENALPSSYDGKVLLYDFVRGWMKAVETDENGEIVSVDDFIDGLMLPMDVEVGPDGSIYVAEFGDSWWEVNEFSGIRKISWGVLERAPNVQVKASAIYAQIGEEITFDTTGTEDPDGDKISFEWDFGDGTTSSEESPSHTYTDNGEYTVRLTVTDHTGKSANWNQTITIGNTPPTVEILEPADKTFFMNGDTFTFKGSAYDEEDGEIACENLEWRLDLLHDEHGHPQEYKTGCEVSYTLLDEGHNYNDNIWWQITLVANDNGNNGAPVLEGSQTIEFIKPRIEAENFDDKSASIDTETTSDIGGGQNIGWTGEGEWLKYEGLNLERMEEIYLRTASTMDYELEIRLDSPDGEAIASIDGTATGDWQQWNTISTELAEVSGTHDIYVYYVSGQTNINWIQFAGPDFPPPTVDCGSNYCFEPITEFENSIDRSNWTVDASHNSESPDAGDAPSSLEYPLDNDLGTRWSSGENIQEGMYYQVNLGEMTVIDQIHVDSGSHWEERGLKDSHQDWFRGYKVEVSADGETWQTVAEKEDNTEYIINAEFDALPARYVKITNTQDNVEGDMWLAIHDLQVMAGELDLVDTVDELGNLLTEYIESDDISNEQMARALNTHLTSLNTFADNDQAEKVVKHLNTFIALLDYQREQNAISELAHFDLKANAENLITLWQ